MTVHVESHDIAVHNPSTGEIIQRVGERILGRVVLKDVYDHITGDIIVKANEMIDEEKVRIIEDAGIEKVLIR